MIGTMKDYFSAIAFQFKSQGLPEFTSDFKLSKAIEG